MRHKIQKVARDLDSILNKGTKERNVKKGEAAIVRRALDLSDMLFATDDDLLLRGLEVDLSDGEEAAIAEYKKLSEKYHSYDDAVSENKEERKKLRSEMNEVKRGFAEALERERKRISEAKASEAFDAALMRIVCQISIKGIEAAYYNNTVGDEANEGNTPRHNLRRCAIALQCVYKNFFAFIYPCRKEFHS